MPNDEQRIKRVTQEIERYFSRHNGAADSLNGVAKWWLTKQRYQESKVIVQKALDFLVANGRIVRTKNAANNVVIYILLFLNIAADKGLAI